MNHCSEKIFKKFIKRENFIYCLKGKLTNMIVTSDIVNALLNDLNHGHVTTSCSLIVMLTITNCLLKYRLTDLNTELAH